MARFCSRAVLLLGLGSFLIFISVSRFHVHQHFFLSDSVPQIEDNLLNLSNNVFQTTNYFQTTETSEKRGSPAPLKIKSCDPTSFPDKETMSRSSYLIPYEPDIHSNNFTVLLLTYNRLQSIAEVVQHYIRMPFVDRLILLWSNQNVPPPERETFTKEFADKLLIKRLNSSDLTLRFADFEEIRTDGVFNVDDDQLVHAKDLFHAFNVWKNHPWALVGPVPRGHKGMPSDPDSLEYVAGAVTMPYSLILTSVAFLHREYLRLFDDRCVSEIRDEINRKKNCEDIFMNFLVKEHCRCSGTVYVRRGNIEEPKNLPARTSLSGRRTHYNERTLCMRRFAKLFRQNVTLTRSSCIY